MKTLKHGWTIGVYGLIFNAQKEVLLIHRRDKNIWQSPGGGVETNETLSEALIREVKEETGYNVKIVKMTSIYFIAERKDIIISFLCEIISGKPQINDEADKIIFWNSKKLPKVTPATKKRIMDYDKDAKTITWAEHINIYQAKKTRTK